MLWSPVSPEVGGKGGLRSKNIGLSCTIRDCHGKVREHSKTSNRRTSTCQSCHLFKVNAAASISIVKSKSPGQLFVVGSLPADTNCQQPFPDKVVLSVSEETIHRPEADFAVLVGVQRIEYKLLHLFGLPASQVALQEYDERLLPDFSLGFGMYRNKGKGHYPISPKRVSEYSFRYVSLLTSPVGLTSLKFLYHSCKVHFFIFVSKLSSK